MVTQALKIGLRVDLMVAAESVAERLSDKLHRLVASSRGPCHPIHGQYRSGGRRLGAMKRRGGQPFRPIAPVPGRG
jgi:hypothetical protein